MKEEDMELIADTINKVISNPDDDNVKKEVSAEVLELTSKFGLYEDMK
jgi:glycine/serine hydroxymethyltransferase